MKNFDESLREFVLEHAHLNEMSPDIYRRAADKREAQLNNLPSYIKRMNILTDEQKNTHKRLREHADWIEKTFGDTKLTEKQCKKILEHYGIKEIVYSGVNSMLVTNLNEKLDNTADLKQIAEHFGKLKHIIPDLIYRLIKVGAKASVNLLVKVAKESYKQGKRHPEIVKNLFYGLLFFSIGYFGNSLKEKYNQNPVIDGTHIETTTVDGNDAMVIYGDDNTTVVMQPEKDKAPVITTVQKTQPTAQVTTPSDYNEKSPITLIPKGGKKISYYHISQYMLDALWDVEHFKDHIYDAKKPSRVPKNQRELLDGSDWTIGAGHKLTRQECRNMKYNKKISVAEGKRLFAIDMKEHERICNNLLTMLPYNDKVNYSQGFFDALCSIEMNTGAGNLAGLNGKKETEFWRRLKNCRIDRQNNCINKSDIEYSLAQINTQNVFLSGHKTRRRAEYFIAMQPFNKEINKDLYNLKS